MSTRSAALLAGVGCGAAWWCASQSETRSRLARLTTQRPTAGHGAPPFTPQAAVGLSLTTVVLTAALTALLGGGALAVLVPAVLLSLARPVRVRAAAAAEQRACAAATPRVADLVAACVSVGAPPAEALDLVRVAVGGPAAARLAPVVSALRLGSDPVAAYLAAPGAGNGPTRRWPRRAATPSDDPLLGLVRAIGRAVASGAPLVDAAELVADEARRRRRWSAEAAARRAGVLAVGPLIVCYLPAFVLLGVVPLVLGVARSALGDLG